MRSAPIQNNQAISINNKGGLPDNCNANTWTGMKNDMGLKVDLSNQENKGGTTNKLNSKYADKVKDKVKKPPIIGIVKADNFALKVSMQPKEFHLYIGNLDVDTEESFVEKIF